MTDLSIACTSCGGRAHLEQPQEWCTLGVAPAICDKCGDVFWVTVTNDRTLVVQPGVTPVIPCAALQLNDVVRVIMPGHTFGRIGRIIDKKPAHYRVDLDGQKVLVPYDGVELYDR